MQNNNLNIDRQVIRTQSAVMDMIAPFAKIIDGIIPHEIQQDALGFLGSLDKPTFPDTISKTRAQFFPNMNAVKGVDTSVPFRLDPSSMTLVDRYHFRRQNETELKHLWKIPTAITTATGVPSEQTYTWINTATVGTTLFLELVGPNSELLGAYPSFAGATGAVPTLMTYLTKPFVHWTGSIEYEVEVFASNGFHQGSLRLSYFPGVYDQSEIPSAVDKSSVYYNILNVSEGTTKIRLRVPYISQYNWLEINNDSRNDEEFQRFRTTGLFIISVAKQLRATGQAAPSVEIIIRRCAGEDFGVANMTMHNGSIQLGSSSWEVNAFRTQSAEFSGETVNQAMALGTVGTSTAVLDVDNVTTNLTAPEALMPSHPRVQQAVGEKGWNMRETGNKQTLFATVDWTDVSANCTILGKWQLPNDALTCQLNNIAKTRFVNIVADMTIQAEVSSSKFQSGALALVFLPLIDAANFTVGAVDTGFLGTLTQMDFTQHVLMHAGRSTSYKMNIQMRHPQAALYLGKGNSLGVLLLVVYSKLATIAGVPPINVMLHATLDNAHVTTPRPCDATVSYKTGRDFNTMAQIREINALEDRVTNLGISRFRTQSAAAPTMDTLVVPTTITPVNADIPAAETADVSLSKLPNQKVMTDLTTRSVQYASHFEDICTNIDTMCKKYTQATAFVDQIEASLAVDRVIDIGNEILFANGTGTAAAYNGSGLLGWYGALYRGFRGDIRIKINIRVLPTGGDTPIPEVYGYVNLDYSKLGFTGQGGAVELFHTNAMLTAPIGPTFLTPGNPHQINFLITPATPEVVELEVPFLHLGQFQIPPSYSGDISQEPYNFGYLNIRLVNSGQEAIIVQTRIFAAFGDAAHFGIPTFIPRVTIVPNQYPDYWSVTPLKREPIPISVDSDTDSIDYLSDVLAEKIKRKGLRSRK